MHNKNQKPEKPVPEIPERRVRQKTTLNPDRLVDAAAHAAAKSKSEVQSGVDANAAAKSKSEVQSGVDKNVSASSKSEVKSGPPRREEYRRLLELQAASLRGVGDLDERAFYAIMSQAHHLISVVEQLPAATPELVLALVFTAMGLSVAFVQDELAFRQQMLRSTMLQAPAVKRAECFWFQAVANCETSCLR